MAEFLPLKSPDYPKILAERTNKQTKALLDKGFRANEYNLCKASTKYWITYYGWIYNPLYLGNEEIQWIPYETQEEFFDLYDELLYRCNQPPPQTYRAAVAMPKSREMGVSWMVIAGMAHDWCFNKGSHLILSRNEDEVSEYGNMDTPFEKLRWLLQHIPEWQLPYGFNWKRHSNLISLENPLGGHIGGDAMSESAGAGGRVRSILFDESAKVKDGKDYKAWTSCSFTSNLKFSVSTPEGPFSKLAQLVKNKKEAALVIWMNWYKDPRKMHNWRWENGKLTSDWNEEARRTLDAESYASQVACSFEASTLGPIYGPHYKDFHQVIGLEPVHGEPIIRSHDPGPHWFTTWCQLLDCGCYKILFEEYFNGKTVNQIADKINTVSNREFGNFEFKDIGDPAGSHKKTAIAQPGDTALKSEYEVIGPLIGSNVQYSFMYKIEKTEWVTRGHQAIKGRLGQMCPEHGTPYLQIDPDKCPLLHRTLSGEYAMKVGHDGTPTDTVNEFHPIEDAADSLKYPPLAAGLYYQPKKEPKRDRRVINRDWVPPGQHRR